MAFAASEALAGKQVKNHPLSGAVDLIDAKGEQALERELNSPLPW